eukprot:TRINITY_DN36178_c0_g1_i1.p1 TRINITY_DN36178_c0_g1~~TRINITY_DN36178_c0_g1_i1.p1  ORF type:complete len:123 (+),score=41.77 TRINITY_DN36178_c0_g1_i1:79-447(+)
MPGREIPAPPGVPPGWKCIEHAFLGGKHAGKTYWKFESDDGKHKNIRDIKALIKIDARERGLDPDEEVAKYKNVAKNAKKEEKQQLASKREQSGIAKGQKREAAEVSEASEGIGDPSKKQKT